MNPTIEGNSNTNVDNSRSKDATMATSAQPAENVLNSVEEPKPQPTVVFDPPEKG
jgi:hypothetical protein